MFGPTDITCIFGQRGSGKSTMGRTIASVYARKIILDRLKEWESGDLVTSNLNTFGEFIIQKFNSRRFTSVFQFNVERNSEIQAATFNEVLRIAYKMGEANKRAGYLLPTCLLIEEIHAFTTANGRKDWLEELATTGRHTLTAMICSTQRPALTSVTLRSQAAHVLIGRLYESNDLKYCERFLPPGDLERVRNLPPFHFLWYRPGHPSRVIPNKF